MRATNLNQIPVLQALLREQSVVRAAESLHLSQPTVSGALAQLRRTFDDPLLVRVGRSMRATPMALRLRPQIDEICAAIDALFEPRSFDPTTAHAQFVVAAPDYLCFLLSKALLLRLRDEAPGVRIRFVMVPLNLPDPMHDGEIDLAVCGNFGLWPQLLYRPLFEERFVAAVAHDHPLARRRRISSVDLAKFPGVNMLASTTVWGGSGSWTTGLPSLDWPAQITVGEFLDVAMLSLESPIAGRGPGSLLEYLSSILPLTVIPFSGEQDVVDTGLFWSARQDSEPAHLWLRELMADAVSSFTSVS